jgi:hypothetical protein
VPGADQRQRRRAVAVLPSGPGQQQPGRLVAHGLGDVDLQAAGGVDDRGEAGEVDGDEVVGRDAQAALRRDGRLWPIQPGRREPLGGGAVQDQEVARDRQRRRAGVGLLDHHDDVGPAPRDGLGRPEVGPSAPCGSRARGSRPTSTQVRPSPSSACRSTATSSARAATTAVSAPRRPAA